MDLCSTCHAGCCRSFAVPITGADVIRIEQETDRKFWDFVCRWADPDSQIARNHAPHFHFADDPDTPFVICLLHEESQNFPGTTRCLFLGEDPPTAELPRGTAHCGIYNSRPGACRAFPTKLNQTGQLAIIYEVPERGRPGTEEAYKLCPRQWELADVNQLETVENLVVSRYEMEFFHSVAEAWNQTKGSWGVFPDFLRLVYSSRVVPEARLKARQNRTRFRAA